MELSFDKSAEERKLHVIELLVLGRIATMKYRCKLLLGFSIVAGLIGSAILTHAQQSAPPSLQPLTGGVYWSDGGAAVNVGVLLGKDGVIVIDARTSANAG